MKKLKFLVKAMLMLYLFSITPNLFGYSITSLNIIPEEGTKVFLLCVESKGSGMIDIKIKDENKRTLFSDQHKALNSFTQKINLNNLSNGQYFVEVENEGIINIQPVIVTGEGISFDSAESYKLFKPTVILNNSTRKLDVNWFMRDYSNGKVVLTDASSNVIFLEKIENQLIYAKRLNITKLGKGTYYLTIENSNQYFQKELKVE